MINLGVVSNVLGVLWLIVGGLMLTTLPFSWYYGSQDIKPMMLSSLVTLIAGGLSLWFRFKNTERITKRDGYLIVGLAWISMSIFGLLPFWWSGVLPHFGDALFESISGFTTTGASVLTDIESVPKGILFWRSMTQWIGGMGIVVLTVALLPLLGIGGIELFVAEAPGPTTDKIHPRIKETAKRLWLIYLGLTTLVTILYFFNGMNFYDAINHGLTTMATGGFSTKNASMAHFSPTIQYISIVFMFLAGTNFTIIYFGLKGKLRKVWSSDEFRTYIYILIVLIGVVTFSVYQLTDLSLERAFRDVAFQIISLITTTGFVSADYTTWSPALTMLCFILLFLGACAGSTSGGIKIIRHLVLFKNSFLEFKRLIHPKALIRVKIDKQVVKGRVVTHILIFVQVFIILFIIGSILMTIILHDFDQPFLTAIGSVATSLGNVGPGIGEVGPVDNFAAIPMTGKYVLSFLMLLGRLELFTLLIILMPHFWKLN